MNKGLKYNKQAQTILKEIFPKELIHLIINYSWKFDYFYEIFEKESTIMNLILYLTHYENNNGEKTEVPHSLRLMILNVQFGLPSFLENSWFLSMSPEHYEKNLNRIQNAYWKDFCIEFDTPSDKLVWESTIELCENKIVWCVNLLSRANVRGIFRPQKTYFPNLLIQV
jgi:hypothetical protein